MKHGLCARGIAAASVALAATPASTAPPLTVYASALPAAVSPVRVSAGLIADGTVTIAANAATTPDIPNDAKPTSRNPAKLHQPLGELVRDHAAEVAADEESKCLAGAVYFEARAESLEGQLAVAEVVLNRAASGEYPATICEVVKQPAQFSFVRDGHFPPIDESSVAWRTAVVVAHIAKEKLAGQARV